MQNSLMLWHVSRLRGAVGRSIALTMAVIARPGSTLSEVLLLVASPDKMLYDD